MKLMKRLFAIVLLLTMTFGLAVEGVAATSPGTVTEPENPGYEEKTRTDTNTQDYTNGTAVSSFVRKKSGAAVTKVTTKKGTSVKIATARDKKNKKVKVTEIRKGAFNNKSGRKIKTVTLASNMKLKAFAFEGSKVKSLKVTSRKVSIYKNAFKKTKVKNMTITLSKVKNASDVSVKEGSFRGLNSKAKIVVTSNMSDKEFNKLVKKLKNAGFKGTITKK